MPYGLRKLKKKQKKHKVLDVKKKYYKLTKMKKNSDFIFIVIITCAH